MNERNKKELLESVLRSEKILGAFEKYNSSYKLNKKLKLQFKYVSATLLAKSNIGVEMI